MSDNPYGSRGVTTNQPINPSAVPSMPSFGTPQATGVDPSIFRNVWQVPQNTNPLSAAQSAIDTLRGIQSYRGGQIELAQKGANALGSYLAPLLSQKGDITVSDIARQYGIAAANGVPGADQAIARLHSIPSDPATLRNYVQTQFGQGLPEGQRLGYVTPGTGPQINTGQAIIPTTTVPPIAGAGAGQLMAPSGGVIQSVPTYPARETLGGKVEWVDANGVRQQGTYADYATARGQGQLLGPAVPVTPSGGGQPTSAPSDGRGDGTSSGQRTGTPAGSTGYQGLPPSLRPSGRGAPPGTTPPATTPTATTTPAPVGGSIPGPTPGVVEAQQQTAGDSAKAYQAINSEAVQSRSLASMYNNMADEVKQYTPGPGADIALDMAKIAQRLGLPVDASKIAAQESVDKIANQLADAMHAGSDARMHVQAGANPSSHNSPQGVQLILKQLLGNVDYLEARNTLAQQYATLHDPGKTKNQAFETDVGKNLDPRVFQFNRLNAQERYDFLQHTDQKAFGKVWDWAKERGLVSTNASG